MNEPYELEQLKAENARLKEQNAALIRINTKNEGLQRKNEELQSAFEYAIHRYWKSYDQYGPYWQLFACLSAVISNLDEKGQPKCGHEHFNILLKEANTRLEHYVKFVKGNEEAQFYLKMEDEMVRLRATHQTALDMLRNTKP